MIAATNTHTHIYARAQTQDASLPRFSPFNGGEEGNPFRGCPVIRGYPRERSPCSRRREEERGGEGWCVTPRAGWTNERNEGREEGGEGEEEEESQFSNGPGESGGLYTTFTDLHYPRIAPTLDTHHRPPQIVPLQRRARDGRTDGWTAGRPAAATTSSVRPTKWHSPSLPPPPTAPVRLLRSTKLCHGGAHISAEILLLGPDVDR